MTTWHVRPDASHGGTNDGTSYDDAWQGWSEIVWGGAGVVGGDTLIVYGAHLYSAAINVGAHGGSSVETICTIQGDDGASISFTANGAFLQNTRAWTRITNLTINASTTGASNNNCIFVTDSATNCKYDNNTLTGGGTAACFSLYGADGQDHTDIEISDNTITNGGGTTGGAIQWFNSASGALSTVTRLSILRNTISGCVGVNDQVIHMRTASNTNASSGIFDLRIEGNTIENCKGLAIRVGSDHNTVGTCAGLKINDNTIRGISYSDGDLGGAIAPRGFTASATMSNEIMHNTIQNVWGAAGGIDLFYGIGYKIRDNVIEDLYTSTIDANGILFDSSNDACDASSNHIRRVYGKNGAANSGVGLMVLDSTNITLQGNLIENCKWGVHIGGAGGGQSCTIVCNTFIGCVDGGIYATIWADLANCTVKNNIFVGDGYTVYNLNAVSWSAEDYNYFYGFSSGESSHTLGANTSTSNPLLDHSYRLKTGSPAIGTGLYIKGVRHFGGIPMNPVSPDIGAHRYLGARTISSSRRMVLTRAT